MKITITFILSLFFLNLTNIISAQEIGFHRSKVLFEAGTNDYHIYRIASIVATKKGSLLAFCSARKGIGGDYDPIDIMMRRSVNSGKSWEPMNLLAHNSSLPSDNATPIVDYETGEVHLLYQVGYSKCFYIKSSDDGKTWTKPVDITAVVNKFKKIYPWRVAAPGPGHGIQLMNGRLVVPFWLSNGSDTDPHRPSVAVSVYSDDHGNTWKADDEIAVPDNDVTVNPSETSVIQLADGRVLFNSRNESMNYRRLLTYSDDGATNWSTPIFADAFFEPICHGSMLRYSIEPFQSKNRILFCNPDSRNDPYMGAHKFTPRSARKRHRTNLTIRMSYDEGHTWPVSKVLDPGISGYSDIAVTPDGKIHVFYEGGSISGSGNDHQNTHMSVATFNLEWMTNGKDQLSNDDKPLNTFIKD